MMGCGRSGSSLCLATLAALASCCLLLVTLLGLAIAAPAAVPAGPPPALVASVPVQTPPPGSAAEPQPSLVGRLALARTAMVVMASTVAHKVVAVSNTRLDQLFAPKVERPAAVAALRAGVVDGADGGTPAGGATAAPAGAAPAPSPSSAAGDAGAAPKRDRVADWAAVGLVVLFTVMALGILAPIVRSMRARKDLLPVRTEEYTGGTDAVN